MLTGDLTTLEGLVLKRKDKEKIKLPNDYLLNNRYRIMGVQGEGGMSVVYVAMDTGLNRIVAIKQTEVTDDKEGSVLLDTVMRESELLKNLEHVAIPSIYDIFNVSRFLFIVMEFLEGEDLSGVLRAVYRDRVSKGLRVYAADDPKEELGGFLPEKMAVSIMLQVANTLRYLHGLKHKIIYRDLKPSNVMLQDDNKIMLFDFGVSRQFTDDYDPNLTTMTGFTRTYAAPEAMQAGRGFDERVDIYSFGLMLHVLLTGQNISKHPEKRRGLTLLRPELSKGLELIVTKCTQLNPNDRYASIEEVIYDLQRYKELERGFKSKHFLNLGIFGTLLTFSLTIGLIGLLLMKNAQNAQITQYKRIVEQASIIQDASTLKGAYKLLPTNLEAYHKAVELYKIDGMFKDLEAKEFLTYINENIVELQEQKGYGELAYEIGLLYWFYGDNASLEGYKLSVRWFEDAIKYGTVHSKTARLYADVGTFYRDIVLNVKEARDSGTYAKHWSRVKEILADEYGSDALRIQVVELVFSTINLYSSQIRMDGVSINEIRSDFNAAKAILNKVDSTSNVINERKKMLLDVANSQVEPKIKVLEQSVSEGNGG